MPSREAHNGRGSLLYIESGCLGEGEMPNVARDQLCPKCGKGLVPSKTGRAGYCSVHECWFPMSDGAVEEAAALNAAIEREFEREREERKQRALQRERERKLARRRAALLRLGFLLLMVALAAFLFTWNVAMPKSRY